MTFLFSFENLIKSSADSSDLVVAITLHSLFANCLTNSKPIFLLEPVIKTVD